MIALVDSHCHLHLLDLAKDAGDLNQVFARAKAQNVQHILNVCVQLSRFAEVLYIAETYPGVSASVGMHPNETEEDTLELLLQYAMHHQVVAIGETGLDYFRLPGDANSQQERFRRHIQVAKQTHKPLIIHTRSAREDTISIMQAEQVHEVGGVMHCFTEDWLCAKKALDMGFYISFSGIVTFKNARDIQEVAKKVPLDRLLIETDSPYLAPHPYRGKTNEPSYLRYTAEYLAALKQVSLEYFAEKTTQNFFRLFTGAKAFYV